MDESAEMGVEDIALGKKFKVEPTSLSPRESAWLQKLSPSFWAKFDELSLRVAKSNNVDTFRESLMWMALFHSDKPERLALYQMLVDSGVDLNFKSDTGKGLLSTLFSGGRSENDNDLALLDLLFKHGLQTQNSLDDGVREPLLTCMKIGWPKCFRKLLEHGADPTKLPTLLHDLCTPRASQGAYENIQSLVEVGGVDVNIQNAVGDTALHVLFNIQNHFSLDWKMCLKARFLLEHGAEKSLSIQNLAGLTPLETVLRPDAKVELERWLLNLRLSQPQTPSKASHRL